LNRIVLAFRAFFNLVFSGELSAETLISLNLSRHSAAAPAKAAAPAALVVRTSDGALQILGILQRDSRLIDFLMEDVSAYSDEQIGAAVRELHDQCRDAIARYVTLAPVIDGVEGTYAKAPGQDANLVKFVGNVPAKPPAGGTLRHKGWRATKVDLPNLAAKQDATIIAAAEIEIE
jgi:type II secretory pathway component PulC